MTGKTQEKISTPSRLSGVEALPAAESSGKWWVLLTIGLGTFMAALDGSIVNITLPTIGSTFAADVSSLEWVVTVYLLVLGSLLLSFGRLGDLRGHKQVYLLGFFAFIFSSILCGLAWNVQSLVAFRALQALGGAMLMANGPAILTKNFPASQRGQALGLQATMTYLGLTVGPSLGGWLTTYVGWHAVFFINVPVGIVAIWAASRFIPADRGKGGTERFDVAGALLFMTGLVSLLLGLNKGSDWGWSSLPVVSLLAAAVVLLSAFLLLERRVPSPMLDLSLFRNPVFSLSVTSALLNYITVYSILFLMPFYLIQGHGFLPSQAGLLLTAQPIIMAIVAPISGTFSDRIGVRLPGTLGMVLLGLGMFMLARLGPEPTSSQIMFALAITGLGTGIFISPNNSALMGSAPHARQGIAAGVLATARNVGMVLGVGMAGAIFTTLLVQAGIDPGNINPEAGAGMLFAFQTTFTAAGVIALLGAVATFVRQ